LEDVQLLYFVFFDKSVISLNETIRYGFKLMGLDDVNFNIYCILYIYLIYIYIFIFDKLKNKYILIIIN